jgi:hypothetical protein
MTGRLLETFCHFLEVFSRLLQMTGRLLHLFGHYYAARSTFVLASEREDFGGAPCCEASSDPLKVHSSRRNIKHDRAKKFCLQDEAEKARMCLMDTDSSSPTLHLLA